MGKRIDPKQKNSLECVTLIVTPCGLFVAALAAVLVLSPTQVYAFPETTPRQTAETDAFPPTYVAEQQSTGASTSWSEDSIFVRLPSNDRAATNQMIGPTLSGHPGAGRFQGRSTQQRIKDMGELLFSDTEGQLQEGLQNFSYIAGWGRSRQLLRPDGSQAGPPPIDNGFSKFILDIVEPHLEPGSAIALSLQGLGRISLLFVTEDRALRSSSGEDPSGRPTRKQKTQDRSRQSQNNMYGSMNSGVSFLRKLWQLGIVMLTHPGFLAFAVFGIGFLILRQLRRGNG